MRSQAWKLCSGAVRCLRSAATAAATGGGLQQQPPQTLAALQQLHTTVAAAAAAAAAAGGPGPGKLSAKRLGLADVQHVIAVASGKGGVGKSTVAVNLAVSLAVQHGLRVGLLDADIHGPSLPTMMGLSGEPEASEEGLLLPPENHRVKCMSMGFFMKGDTPVVWRGPIVNSAIDRFLMGTAWGHLDVLVVDMPPGTGDAQIGLGQRLPLAGAVIVSTPQDVALLDARRGAQMFRKVHVPLLGLVENMAYYCCPNCGHQDNIFGSGGVAAAAEDLGVPLLGQVPLNGQIRHQSDIGVPIVMTVPDSPAGQAYSSIAGQVKARLSSAPCEAFAKQPTITID